MRRMKYAIALVMLLLTAGASALPPWQPQKPDINVTDMHYAQAGMPLLWNFENYSKLFRNQSKEMPFPEGPDAEDIQMQMAAERYGRLEANGTQFELKNSSYLNITLDSSEPIKLVLESTPEMVTMHIESASSAASSQITMSGFLPSTTYHKYEDDYHNHTAFTTNAGGNYSCVQDISVPHLVFIQPRASTKFIIDNETGGDCTSIGTWNAATKTCTLTTDLTETVQIDSDSITLDGNGRTITGSYTGSGVFLSGRNNVSIKNLGVKHFSNGIYLYSSSNNTLSSNNASNNQGGIGLESSSNNTLSGNNANSNNYYGIYLESSSSNMLSGNNASNNYYGIFLYSSSNNTLSGNNASNNVGGYYGGYGIYLYSSSSNMLSGNNASNNRNGIYLYSSSNNTLSGNNASNNRNGIFLYSSSNNTLSGNNASNNVGGYYGGSGIYLASSGNNTLSGNNANSNYYDGIYLYSSSNNTLSGNNASGSYFGIYLYYSSNNIIYLNNLIKNTYNADSLYSTNTIWNSPQPITYTYNGTEYINKLGNYWSDYSGIDGNGNGIGDNPYEIQNGETDYYPLMQLFETYIPTYILTYYNVKINITGTPQIGKSTGKILKVEYTNFSLGDPYNITITAPNGTGVYCDSGNLTGANPEIIPINWTPGSTGNHKIEAWGRGMIDSTPLYVYDSAVVSPIPELSTMILTGIGMLGLVFLARRKR
jgi:parallel beta-helix repeat protein